jgi:hypothetical protein
MQRVSDAYRSSIGSTGLLVVNAFYESKQDAKTDEDRQTFARQGLEGLKFLYSDTTADDGVSPIVLADTSIYFVQQYKGIFCGPLVLRTFAAHFNAIRGAVDVRGLITGDKPHKGGLVLSAVSVRVCVCFRSCCRPLVSLGATRLDIVGDWCNYPANGPGCQDDEEQGHLAPEDYGSG